MLLLGIITGGIFTAFVFSRRVSFRSEADLQSIALAQGMVDELRLAVGGAGPNGLSLAPGINVDDAMQNPPAGADTDPDNNPATPNPLNLPPAFQTKYQTTAGYLDTDPTVQNSPPNLRTHGDGRVLVVEEGFDAVRDGVFTPNLAQDLDGDGLTGVDFDDDGTTDLRRVRLSIRWTTPNP